MSFFYLYTMTKLFDDEINKKSARTKFKEPFYNYSCPDQPILEEFLLRLKNYRNLQNLDLLHNKSLSFIAQYVPSI